MARPIRSAVERFACLMQSATFRATILRSPTNLDITHFDCRGVAAKLLLMRAATISPEKYQNRNVNDA